MDKIMELSALLQHTQIAVPVALVLVCALLVFTFGFRKAEQPSFAQLSCATEAERKSQTKKKSKSKEKRTVNGQITAEKASPKKLSKSEATTKKTSKSDEVDTKIKERKQDDNKAITNKKTVEGKHSKENKVEQVKNKKNIKNLLQEKPVDYDEGDWEQAYSRKEKLKKKREEESPSKKSKKSKKGESNNETSNNKNQSKPEIKDKIAKETENKELKEKNNKEVVLTPIFNNVVEQEKEVEVLEEISEVENRSNVEKNEEKKYIKSKKSKKNIDPNNIIKREESLKEDKVVGVKVSVDKKLIEVASKVESIEIMGTELIEDRAITPAFNELGDVWKEAKPPKKK